MAWDDIAAIFGVVSALLSALYAWGVRRGHREREEQHVEETNNAQAAALERLTNLTSSMLTTVKSLDERGTETLRQVSSLHDRLDHHASEIHRIDKEQTGTAMILKWMRSTGRMVLPPSEEEEAQR